MTDEGQRPLNREQRRAQKFRARSTARQDNLHTPRENATGFLALPTDSLADGPKGDVTLIAAAESTSQAGPGGGGDAPTEAAVPDPASTAPADQPPT